MARLWVHECYRVFSDRLVGDKDHETFNNLIGEKLGVLFNLSFNNLCKNKQLPLFGENMLLVIYYFIMMQLTELIM